MYKIAKAGGSFRSYKKDIEVSVASKAPIQRNRWSKDR